MKEDISKRTLFVLIVLTVVISALCTWTVLSSISENQGYVPSVGHAAKRTSAFEPYHGPPKPAEPISGEVSVNILPERG